MVNKQVSARVLGIVKINSEHLDVLGSPVGLIIQDIEYEALLCDDGAVTVSCKLVGVERLNLA